MRTLALSFGPADAAQPSSCTIEAGYVGGPYVPSREAAIAIYRAVVKAIAPQNVRQYPIIVVEDKGDHWGIGQTRRDQLPRVKNGEVVVTAGGGGLSMSVDKCTGAISEVAFSR